MSSKSKVPKIVAPKPKYSLGQKVFYITYHKGLPDSLFEAKILKRNSTEYWSGSSSTPKPILNHYFMYDIYSDTMEATDVYEEKLYPSFFEAAKVFAKGFLYLLK